MLEALFKPASVAVVGAAREEGKLGYTVLRAVIDSGYPGAIYPINPKATQILDLPAYPSVSAVPGPVELAVIVVPRPAVIPVMRDCAAKGVKAAIIITAGFREVGPEGVEAENAVMRIARSAGIRVLGPNVLGLIDTSTPLNASFAPNMPKKGEIAFMSQSGAICSAILDWAQPRDLGFSKFVSLGNKADITEVDLLQAWGDAPETRVIIGYLEGISDGQRFMRVAKELTKRKPVIIVKSGRTAAGSRAVSSHTGTLAGSDAAYTAAFKQSGVIRAETMEELFDLSIAFAYQPLPDGKRLAIITNAGGPGIIATDASERIGLSLAGFTNETISALRSSLPPAASVYNPVDVLGDAKADRYQVALDLVMKDPGVDGVLVLLTPQAATEPTETAKVVVAASRNSKKPILASFVGGTSVEEAARILNAGRVPNYSFPERAVEVFAEMSAYDLWRDRTLDRPFVFDVDREKVRAVFQRVREMGRNALIELEAREVVSAYGLKMPRSELARSEAEAVAFAEDIGYPVVMKIVSPDILHKSEVGGVRVGLRSSAEVHNAFVRMLQDARRFVPSANIWGVAIQEMVKPGRETIIGVTFDPQFGHLLMFGLGGIYVEVLKDVSFRLAPLTAGEARSMVREIKAFPLLAGVRGQKPADTEAVVDALLRLSQLVTDFPEVAELDVNPLVVNDMGEGAIALDARIILAQETPVSAPSRAAKAPIASAGSQSQPSDTITVQ